METVIRVGADRIAAIAILRPLSKDCFLDRHHYILVGSKEKGLIGYHINICRG